MEGPVRCYYLFKGEFEEHVHRQVKNTEMNLEIDAEPFRVCRPHELCLHRTQLVFYGQKSWGLMGCTCIHASCAWPGNFLKSVSCR